MPHHLTGFQSVTIGVGDPAAARACLQSLGFTVDDDGGALTVALGNACLRFAPNAPAGFGAVVLGSRDPAASRAALGDAVRTDGTLDTPGLETILSEAAAPRPGHHVNGAVALASLTAVLDSPDAATAAYDRLFGLFAATPTDDMVTVHGCGPMLFLVTQDGFDHLHSNLQNRLPAPPALAAVAVAVTDLAAAEAHLAAAGVRVGRSGASLSIAPSDCFGLGLELVPA